MPPGDSLSLSNTILFPLLPLSSLDLQSFVHGGAYFPLYEGSNTAVEGNVIVVTINYRLGIFGFMYNEVLTQEDPNFPTSGNYGLTDQIQALKWVKDNIRSFGGNPKSVTVYGESAGSISTCLHTVMPQSKGLFSRAIMESGVCTFGYHPSSPTRYFFSRADKKQYGEVTMGRTGCLVGNPTKSIECLRQVDAHTLMERSDDFQWGPSIDNWLIPDDPLVLYQNGSINHVDILLGANTNEGVMFVPGGVDKFNMTTFDSLLSYSFIPSALEPIKKMYAPPAMPSAGVAYARILNDYFFTCGGRRLLNILQASSTSYAHLYQYHFAHVPSFNTCPGLFCKYKGEVQHTAEIPFVFNNQFAPFGIVFTPEEDAFSKKLTQLWTSFAKTGVPKNSDLTWSLYGYTETYLELKLSTTVKQGFKMQICEFWDSLTSDESSSLLTEAYLNDMSSRATSRHFLFDGDL